MALCASSSHHFTHVPLPPIAVTTPHLQVLQNANETLEAEKQALRRELDALRAAHGLAASGPGPASAGATMGFGFGSDGSTGGGQPSVLQLEPPLGLFQLPGPKSWQVSGTITCHARRAVGGVAQGWGSTMLCGKFP